MERVNDRTVRTSDIPYLAAVIDEDLFDIGGVQGDTALPAETPKIRRNQFVVHITARCTFQLQPARAIGDTASFRKEYRGRLSRAISSRSPTDL